MVATIDHDDFGVAVSQCLRSRDPCKATTDNDDAWSRRGPEEEVIGGGEITVDSLILRLAVGDCGVLALTCAFARGKLPTLSPL